MTIKETRHANLLLLVKQAGGNKSEVARCARTTPTYINDIINGAKTPAGTIRGVGDALARRLESGFEKKEGWMDVDHELSASGAGEALPDYDVIGPLSEAEKELVCLAREYGLTDNFIQISKKHLKK